MGLRAWWLLLTVVWVGGCHGRAERPPVVAPQSAAPGINDAYRDPDVAQWQQRFESESRETFAQRERVLAVLDVRRGMTVADIGAGTGFYTLLFAEQVGPAGEVFAVDITPKFLELIRERTAERGLEQVRTVACAADDVRLPANSVDVAFICDTYHHFEYPVATMRTLYEAMKPGGRVYVLDFIREEGVSREWILEHVRAGEEQVVREIRAIGFEPLPAIDDSFLEENYIVAFRKPR